MTNLPYLKQNENKKYNFYCIIITSICDEVCYGETEIIENLTGITTNEWVFNMYINYYKKLIDESESYKFYLKNLTWNEMLNVILEETGCKIDDDYYIISDYIKLIDEPVFANAKLIDESAMYENDFGGFSTKFIHNIMEANELINGSTGIYFKDSFDIVSKLLNRMTNVYVPVLEIAEYGEYDQWFNELTDNGKVFLTKLCNFPKPLEEYEYFDIYNCIYTYLYYLDQMIDLKG